MVQYSVHDRKYKTTVWYDTRRGIENSRIQCKISTDYSSDCNGYYSHDSMDSVISTYAPYVTNMKLYSIGGLTECQSDILSKCTVLKSMYMQSVKVLPGTSTDLFSNDTLQTLELYIVHDIDGIGQLPNLSKLSIKYCTLSRLPDLSECHHLKHLDIRHCMFSEQSALDIDSQLTRYIDSGVRLITCNNRDDECVQVMDYRWNSNV